MNQLTLMDQLLELVPAEKQARAKELLQRWTDQQAQGLQEANQQLDHARLAALNMMEDAVLAKERLEITQYTLDQSADAVFWMREDSRLIYANDSACRMLDYSKKELLALSIPDIDPNYPIERSTAIFEKARSEGSLLLETELTARSGRIIPVEIHLSFVQFESEAFVCAFAHDITHRKKSHQALQRSEARYRRLFEQSTDGCLLIQNNCFIDCNQAAVDMLGYPDKSALLKKHPGDLSPPEQADGSTSRRKAEEYIQRALNQKYVRFEWLHQRMDGSAFPVEVTLTAIQDDEGRQLIHVGWRDISEIKKRQHQLHELSNIQSLILENSTMGIALVKNRRFKWFNSRLAKILGIPQAELRNASTRVIYPNDAVYEELGDAAYKALAKTNHFDLTTHFQHGDGSPFWCRVIGSAISSELPDEGSIWIIEDITAQKEAEIERIRLSTAIEQSPEAVVITDPEGTIVYVNPAFEVITGYTRDEALGQNASLLKSGKQDDAFYRVLWDTITAGKVWKGVIVNRRKDGTHYTQKATIAPVKNEMNQIVNYVAVKRDITEELEREENLRQAQKMEAVGQLAGGIAHDFNNILQGIQGFSELLKMALEPDSQPYTNADEIHKSARQAAKLTQQMLSFSRKQPALLKPVDLNQAVYDAESLLHVLLGERLELHLELNEGCEPVIADEGQLSQIIMNLTVNARDAMPDGGRLTITTDRITLTAKDIGGPHQGLPGTYICLSFTDTGCGMSQEVQDRLFEPFFTTKEVGSGTGLGMSVVYGIMQQLDGWTSVYSEPGKGSCLKLYFPAMRTLEADGTKGGAHSPEKLFRILFVEDDPDVERMMMDALNETHFTAVSAESAEEALARAEQEKVPFDLLMADMMLPGLRGDELADVLRERCPDLPVLLFSGYRDQHTRWPHLAARDYMFLNKPFTVKEVLDILSGVLKMEPDNE